MQRLFIFLLSAYLACAPAHASQHNLWSATTGTVSGLDLTNNFNNGLDSLNTMNSGTAAPTNQLSGVPSSGNWWLNTTANPYPANVYDGANWLAPFYVDATNHLILNQVGGGTATIASATTTSLCSVPQYFETISGTTTITSFGTGCFIGQAKKIAFSGALTLTYNASSLIIPGAANVPTAAGDTADVVYLGSGNWQVTNYQPANGQALLNPAVDVGTYVMTSAVTVPSAKYQLGDGHTVLRASFPALLTAITITQSVTATSGSPTLTGFSDTTQIPIGAIAEAAFLPSNTAVVSKTSSTVTFNKNAAASTTGNVTIFPYGDGDGSTSFNLPNCAGVTLAGRDNMSGTPRGLLTSSVFGGSQSIVPGANPDSLGAVGGTQSGSFAIAQANLPNVNFNVSGITLSSVLNLSGMGFSGAGCRNDTSNCNGGSQGNLMFTAGGNNTLGVSIATTATGSPQGTAASGGSGTAIGFNSVPPTMTANCMIRVLSFLTPLRGAPVPAVANDNQLAAIEPRGAWRRKAEGETHVS